MFQVNQFDLNFLSWRNKTKTKTRQNQVGASASTVCCRKITTAVNFLTLSHRPLAVAFRNVLTGLTLAVSFNDSVQVSLTL